MNHATRSMRIVGAISAAAFLFTAAPAFAATLAIQTLSPGSTVNYGNQVTFTALPTGLTSNVTFAVSDSFGGSTLTNSNINGSGILYWTPTSADVGSHTITVTASDNTGNASATQQITVTLPPTVALQSLSNGTSTALGSTVTFTAVPSNFQGTNYSYSVSDTDPDTSINSSSINSTGHFSWTPSNPRELGLHTVTVTVNGGGSTASATQRFDVGQSSGASAAASRSVALTSLSPGTTTAVGASVTAVISPNGFTPSSYYVSDAFGGSSITYSNVNSTGVFSWTPKVTDVGSHAITFYGYDNLGSSVSTSTTIAVSLTGATVPAVTTVAAAPTPAPVSTPSTSGYYFTASLQTGSTGADVTALQNILIKNGYLTAAANGVYGAATTAAVKKYQAAHGISQLGTVGPSTRVALNAETGASVATPTTSVTTTTAAGMSAATKAVLLQIALQLQQLAAQLSTLASQ